MQQPEGGWTVNRDGVGMGVKIHQSLNPGDGVRFGRT